MEVQSWLLGEPRASHWLEGQSPKGKLEKGPHPAQGLEKLWNQPKIIRIIIHNGGSELASGRTPSFPLAGRPESQGWAGEGTTPCPRAGEVVEPTRAEGGRGVGRVDQQQQVKAKLFQ